MKRISIKKTGRSFPLYDRLASQGGDSEKIDPRIWTQFGKLDKENAAIVYYLILHYARLNGKMDEVPYARKVMDGGKGVSFGVDGLPPDLKVILANCIREITNI